MIIGYAKMIKKRLILYDKQDKSFLFCSFSHDFVRNIDFFVLLCYIFYNPFLYHRIQEGMKHGGSKLQ